MEKSTGQLMSELNRIISIEDFHRQNAPEMQIPNAAEYILAAAAAKNICRSELVNRSGMERTYAEHLLGGRKRLMREKIIIFCLAGSLSVEEAQNALKYAAQPVLYPRDRRDSVLIYALRQGMDVITANELLDGLGLPLLQLTKSSS